MTVHLVQRRANYATVPLSDLSPGGWPGVRGLVHRSVVGQGVPASSRRPGVPARFSETGLPGLCDVAVFRLDSSSAR